MRIEDVYDESPVTVVTCESTANVLQIIVIWTQKDKIKHFL